MDPAISKGRESNNLPGQLCQPWGINKDATIWLDGARPPPKYVFKNNMSLTNSKIRPTDLRINFWYFIGGTGYQLILLAKWWVVNITSMLGMGSLA